MDSSSTELLTDWLRQSFPRELVPQVEDSWAIAHQALLNLVEEGEVEFINAKGGTDNRPFIQTPEGRWVHVGFRLNGTFGSLANILAGATSTAASGTAAAALAAAPTTPMGEASIVLGIISGALWTLSAFLLASGLDVKRLTVLHGEICAVLIQTKEQVAWGQLFAVILKRYEERGKQCHEESIRLAVQELRNWGFLEVNDNGTFHLIERDFPIAFFHQKEDAENNPSPQSPTESLLPHEPMHKDTVPEK